MPHERLVGHCYFSAPTLLASSFFASLYPLFACSGIGAFCLLLIRVKFYEIKIIWGICVQVLDDDHFGLEQVKLRIVQYLALRIRNPTCQGAILCFGSWFSLLLAVFFVYVSS
jgi:hypothetical protein